MGVAGVEFDSYGLATVFQGGCKGDCTAAKGVKNGVARIGVVEDELFHEGDGLFVWMNTAGTLHNALTDDVPPARAILGPGQTPASAMGYHNELVATTITPT